jgi:uncharacterized protein YjiS (DUF1127 family)
MTLVTHDLNELTEASFPVKARPRKAVLVLLSLWAQRRQQRAALAELDDRLLKDVDLSQDQAKREAAKPFWR